MLRFKQFILEARKNADNPAQRKLNALEILEKHKDNPNAHISYTTINKIGINPKSKFPDTPLGVYAYPLKQVWNDLESEGVSNVPFAASSAKYVFVLEEKSKPIVDVSDYKRSDLKRDMQKISDTMSDETYEKSLAVTETMLNTKLNKTKDPFLFLRIFLYKSSGKHLAGPFMSKTLLELGYSGFSDRKGKGYIHSAEPVQSFFMSSRYYRVLEVIDLKSLDFKDMDRRERTNFIKQNAKKMSDSELLDAIKDDIELLKYAGPPRTEVLKTVMGMKRDEIWKSKQTKPVENDNEFETSSSMYSPGEGFFDGNYVLKFYKKLPEEFIEWGLKSGNAWHIKSWAKNVKYKFKKSMLDRLLKDYSDSVIDLYDEVDANTAKIYYEKNKNVSALSGVMSETEYAKFLSSIDNYELPFRYNKIVANDLYKKLLKKSNPTEDDIFYVAGYVQSSAPLARSGSAEVPMDIVDGLKSKFPEVDFRMIGAWDFWKR